MRRVIHILSRSVHRASDPCPLFALWSVAVSKSSYTRYTSMSPDAHLRTDRMPRVRGPPSARRRGRWSARPRGRAPSPTSPVPHTLYSTIPEAELRTTDRVTRPPTIKHITLPRPTSFFYYFLFFEKGSVESTHKVPTSHSFFEKRSAQNVLLFEKGSVESTHKVPTSHYHSFEKRSTQNDRRGMRAFHVHVDVAG